MTSADTWWWGTARTLLGAAVGVALRWWWTGLDGQFRKAAAWNHALLIAVETGAKSLAGNVSHRRDQDIGMHRELTHPSSYS